MVLTLVGCSSKTTDIEGTITGYVPYKRGLNTEIHLAVDARYANLSTYYKRYQS